MRPVLVVPRTARPSLPYRSSLHKHGNALRGSRSPQKQKAETLRPRLPQRVTCIGSEVHRTRGSTSALGWLLVACALVLALVLVLAFLGLVVLLLGSRLRLLDRGLLDER